LVEETKGYKVVTIGSSAGGFAAVLLGSMLSAIRIYSFNGQFMLSDLLTSSSELINPTVFRRRNQPEFNQYYSLRRYITNADRIFYFVSQKSEWDYRQFEHVASLNINTFFFNTSHHGIPFIKDALPVVINLPSERLITRKNKMLNPILFSVS